MKLKNYPEAAYVSGGRIIFICQHKIKFSLTEQY